MAYLETRVFSFPDDMDENGEEADISKSDLFNMLSLSTPGIMEAGEASETLIEYCSDPDAFSGSIVDVISILLAFKVYSEIAKITKMDMDLFKNPETEDNCVESERKKWTAFVIDLAVRGHYKEAVAVQEYVRCKCDLPYSSFKHTDVMTALVLIGQNDEAREIGLFFDIADAEDIPASLPENEWDRNFFLMRTGLNANFFEVLNNLNGKK